MRVLEFTVSGQKIQRSKDCDFTGLVAGSRGYLWARFHFSNDWAGCKKVAVFMRDDKEYPASINNGICEIPEGALLDRIVKVYVIGRRPSFDISTNTVSFMQKITEKGAMRHGND